MREQLIQIMQALSLVRPLFHSEFDFQFSLAQLLTANLNLGPQNWPRLERPFIIGDDKFELDIFFQYNGMRVGIELKYPKARLNVDIKGEEFRLVNHGAHSGARFHFFEDISRLEKLVTQGRIDYGFAIILTKCKYWLPIPENRDRNNSAICLRDGREIIPGYGVCFLYNEAKLQARNLPINGRYKFLWIPYGPGEDNEFELKYLLTEYSGPIGA